MAAENTKHSDFLKNLSSHATRRYIIGYLLTFGVLLNWTSSTVAVHYLQRVVPDFQLSAYRYITQLLICLVVIYFKGIPLQLKREQLPLVLLMCVTSLLYNVFYFAAAAILPLAHVFAGFIVASMLGIAILTKFFLRKDLGCAHGLSLLFASLGVAFINQPWSTFGHGFLPIFMMSNRNSSISFQHHENQSVANNLTIQNLHGYANETDLIANSFLINVTVATGYGFILLAGFAEAINLLVVGMYLRDLSPFFQGFLASIVDIPASFLLSMYMEEFQLETSSWEILLLVMHCMCISISIICCNGAAQMIDPSLVCLIESFAVVIFLILQYTLMNNGLTGRRNALEVIGAIIITASIIFSTLTSVPKILHEDL